MMMATMTSSSIEGVLAHKKCIALPIISPYSIYSLDEWMAVEKEKEKRKDRYILRVANRSLSPLLSGIIQSRGQKEICVYVFSLRSLFILFSFSLLFWFLFSLYSNKLGISNIYNAQIHYKLLRIHENEMDQLWWIGLRIRKRAKYLLFI